VQNADGRFKGLIDHTWLKWLFAILTVLFALGCFWYAGTIADKYDRDGAAFIFIGTGIGAAIGMVLWGIYNTYSYFSYKTFGCAAIGSFIGLMVFMSGT
jgi:hypothetical protein